MQKLKYCYKTIYLDSIIKLEQKIVYIILFWESRISIIIVFNVKEALVFYNCIKDFIDYLFFYIDNNKINNKIEIFIVRIRILINLFKNFFEIFELKSRKICLDSIIEFTIYFEKLYNIFIAI